MPLFSSPSSKCFWITLIVFSLSYYLLIAKSTTLQTSPPPPKPCNKNPYKQLNLVLNKNGSVRRGPVPPESPPAPDPNLPTKVLSKDLPINKSKGTWARIYLPRETLDQNSKLPLLVFFHGGGFIFLSASSTIFHEFCFNMANDVVAVVASIEYRLAPEHRLPAAYEDAVEALHWIKTNQEEDDWLRYYADLSNVFLVGSSAGGNIAYNAGLRLVATGSGYDLGIPKIQGLILIQPYFGGTQMTGSEMRLANEPHLSLCNNYALWELSLPVGADRDHEYCNPTVGDGPKKIEMIRRLGWRVLVTGCGGDPLVDRQMELVKVMEMKGVKVVGHFRAGDYHGVQDTDPFKAKQLYEVKATLRQKMVSLVLE
ncbi:carboxylesterase 1-like isoform X2 [Arachis hypogaea]|uniref:carboxylesterase 1-like isoform X2 n=1 Tax=Arachis hypogaea TaxID=3818 RepID=UPI0034E73DD6